MCRCRIINLYLDNKYWDNCINNNPCDLCLKCKDMRFNANFWSVEEKEIKVLEWHKHIKWAYKERENYK